MNERVGADLRNQNDAPAPSIYRSTHTDKQRVELSIGKIPWPARSPDLNRIENVGYVEEANKEEVQKAAPPQSKRILKVAQEE